MTPRVTLWALLARTARPGSLVRLPSRRRPKGPAQPVARYTAPLVSEALHDELKHLVDCGGSEWAREMMTATWGPKWNREWFERTNARRREYSRVVEAAWNEFLADQYPHVRTRVVWRRSAAFAKGGLWRCLVRFEVWK